MEAFVGKWKAEREHVTGIEEYGMASGAPEAMKIFLQGSEMEVTQCGECWEFTTHVGGYSKGKELIDPKGTFKYTMPDGSAGDAQVSVVFEGGKLIAHGTMSGQHYKCVRYMGNGRLVVELHAATGEILKMSMARI